MPLILPDKLPAIELLKRENIFVVNGSYSLSNHVGALKIVILNLMPLKIATEVDFIRVLSTSDLLLDISFMGLKSHVSKNTSPEHIATFYSNLDALADQKFDGMIVTGAPIENLEFEAVDYWDELTGIFAWARTHATSVLNICWGAQASLYYNYNIKKYPLEKKKFGVFKQRILAPELPVFNGFGGYFNMPVSRHTEIRREDIIANKELRLIAESDDSGVGIVMACGGREFFVTGHLEYHTNTLDKEYRRDAGRRDDVDMPVNYYRGNNPNNAPSTAWREHANLFFNNWLTNYVCTKVCKPCSNYIINEGGL